MPSRSFRLLHAAMLTGAANIAIVGSAHAQEQAMSFNMPDQSLSSALKDYALKTGKNLVYPPSMIANKRANAINGRLTPTQALRLLLRGTSISFREIQPNVVTLRIADTSQRRNAARFAVASPTAVQAASISTAAQNDGSSDDGSTGVVAGTVVNRSTGAALKGALVRVDGTNLETITDDRGHYYFPAVPRGQQIIRVEYLGEQARTAIVSVSPGSRQQANVQIGDANQDIVVFGYRSSIQQALNKQKNADNSATVVSSDLLGGFPAETVSEALRRVPGVAFGRDDETGEGSRITVRGFSSEAINVQLNGLELQGTSFDRTIDLSGFLADNISQVTIHKSLLPSHESTGSGGLVEIETKSGLDYGDFALNLSAEGERNFKSRFGDEYQFNGTLAKKITPNFGVAATIQYRKTDRSNYDVSIVDIIPPVFPIGFNTITRIPASFEFPFDPEVNQQLITSSSYTRRERAEESIVGSINFAWDIADHTKLRLDLQRNVRDVQSSNALAAIGFRTFRREMPIPELGGEVRQRQTLTALVPRQNFTARDEKLTSDTISFRGDTNVGRFEIFYKAGYARSRAEGNNSSIALLQTASTDIFDLINPSTILVNPDDDAAQTPRVVGGGFFFADNGIPVPSLTAEGLARISDPSRYDVRFATVNPIDNPTTSYSAELKARYIPAPDFIDYVEIGSKYNRNVRETVGTFSDPRQVLSQRFSRIIGRETPLSVFDSGTFSNEDFGRLGANGFFVPFLTSDVSKSIFAQLPDFVADDPATMFNEERYTFSDFTTVDPILDSAGFLRPTKTIEEKIAGYLEAKVNFGRFDLVAGVRYERERRDGQQISSPTVILDLPGIRREPRETFVDAGLVFVDSTAGTVQTWTPSFLATYRPNSNIVARLGYFRSTVHPDIRLLNRGRSFSVDLRPAFANVTIREANPNLKPSTTDNVDFDIAYYFDDTPGLVRASLFYKKISNNFTNVLSSSAENGDVEQRFRERFAPLADTRPEFLELQPNTEFLVNRPENGEGGTIWGAEFEVTRRLNFLPGFLSDFGILANATYTNGDFPTLVSARDDNGDIIQLSLDRALRDQARWVYNLSLDYERDGFQGRVIFTHQDATAQTFDEFNLNTVIPSYSTLDARFSYSFERFGGLFTVFVEGDNLLQGSKEADIRSTTSSQFGIGSADFNFPQSLQFNGGRTVTMGIRANF
ncbi:TonB-dependent receptor [Parasphingorhabdus litoris]|nr:TonB-dependent receptor [Parasphingorhabdus litoris]